MPYKDPARQREANLRYQREGRRKRMANRHPLPMTRCRWCELLVANQGVWAHEEMHRRESEKVHER